MTGVRYIMGRTVPRAEFKDKCIVIDQVPGTTQKNSAYQFVTYAPMGLIITSNYLVMNTTMGLIIVKNLLTGTPPSRTKGKHSLDLSPGTKKLYQEPTGREIAKELLNVASY